MSGDDKKPVFVDLANDENDDWLKKAYPKKHQQSIAISKKVVADLGKETASRAK